MADLHTDASAVITRVYRSGDAPQAVSSSPFPDSECRAFHASQSGFVQAVDTDRLTDWAAEHGVMAHVSAGPGRHVLTGDVLGHCYGPVPDDVDDELAGLLLIGHERTPDEDPGFGLVQLVDIGLRALSPGVNDPTTAVHALGHLASLLVEMARLPAHGLTVIRDDQGEARVFVDRPTLGEHLEATCLPLIRAGSADPRILLAIADLLKAVDRVAEQSERSSVQAMATYAQRAGARGLDDEHDATAVQDALAPLATG